LVPTAGDAFIMIMGVTGKAFTERKLAGRALMQDILTFVQLQHEKETVIASISGFDLGFDGQRLGWDGYHYTTLLEIELSMIVTPLGAVARLEHALSNFEGESETYRHRLTMLASASRPTARASTRLAFDAELALKRSELATIEADPAASSETGDAQSRKAA
jgi:hypothetical protein